MSGTEVEEDGKDVGAAPAEVGHRVVVEVAVRVRVVAGEGEGSSSAWGRGRAVVGGGRREARRRRLREKKIESLDMAVVLFQGVLLLACLFPIFSSSFPVPCLVFLLGVCRLMKSCSLEIHAHPISSLRCATIRPYAYVIYRYKAHRNQFPKQERRLQ